MKTKFEIESKIKNHYDAYSDYESLELLNIFKSHPDTIDLLEELKSFLAQRWNPIRKKRNIF